MKKSYLFFLLLTVVLSCKKSTESELSNPFYKGLPGTWELRTISGTIAGGLTTYPSGNGHVFVFTNDTYKYSDNAGTTRQGSYILKKQLTYLTQKMEDTIVFDGNSGGPVTIISLNGSTLTLSLDADDGGTTTYARIK